MEVLLLKDVPKLGRAGDEVRVADGYARNYLLPRKLAIPLDEGARRQAEEIREARQRQLEREQREAQAQAGRLEGLVVTVTARAGDQGKLYGSVTAADIAEKLMEQHRVEVDRRRVSLPDPIRELGEREVEIRLAQSVVAHVRVVVEREDQEG
ncbi:MAG: 50S ribosomal protein L9 [Anaerolineae bacterium]|nr:50S ribosomal protein L9 [Anaerolineae bacterium]